MHPRPTRADRSPIRRDVGGHGTLALALGTIALAIGLDRSRRARPPRPRRPPPPTDPRRPPAPVALAAAVQGMPAVHAGSAAGDYLWHDATGWHLRVTHPGTSGLAFSGTIRANKPLHVTGYPLEKGDTFTVSADKLSVTYRFRNYGRLDGLDFTTECATRLGVSGRMSGALLPARRIWIGHAGRHPLGNPFAILRRAA